MYTNTERRIFRYHNGEKKVAADPLAIQRRLLSHGTLIADFKLLSIKNPESLDQQFAVEVSQAFERLLTAARSAFKLKELNEDDETGLTDEEAMKILVDFGAYMEVLKNEQGPMQTRPNSTESESSHGATGSPTMPSMSDSTSTSNEH